MVSELGARTFWSGSLRSVVPIRSSCDGQLGRVISSGPDPCCGRNPPLRFGSSSMSERGLTPDDQPRRLLPNNASGTHHSDHRTTVRFRQSLGASDGPQPRVLSALYKSSESTSRGMRPGRRRARLASSRASAARTLRVIKNVATPSGTPTTTPSVQATLGNSPDSTAPPPASSPACTGVNTPRLTHPRPTQCLWPRPTRPEQPCRTPPS